MILELFFYLNDPMILYIFVLYAATNSKSAAATVQIENGSLNL